MFVPASIRWRLQIWLGILLVGVLTAFGTTAWQLEKTKGLRRLDDDLEKQVALLGAAVRQPGPGMGRGGPGPRMGRGGGPGGGPRSNGGGADDSRWRRDGGGDPSPDDFFFPDDKGKGGQANRQPPSDDELIDRWLAMGDDPPEFEEWSLSPSLRAFFSKNSVEGFYYVVWTGWAGTPARSGLAPEEVPKPSRADQTTQVRFRDREGVREVYYFTERGDCILAGRPVARDLAAMRPVAYTLLLSGLAILAVGLGGAWWLTTLSIRPIEDIAEAARRISENNLSERIPPGPPGNELGSLAEVLNTTFERLEDSFAQQKRFTSDASHELRTPLTVLISEVQTALSRERTAAEYREVLEGNLDTARQMKRLAEALLELARLDAGDERDTAMAFDLALVVRERAEKLTTLAAEKAIRIDLDLKSALIQGSPDRLALVVTNLVENAIHYGRHGGMVIVTTRTLEDEVELEVADDGSGIPAADLPHIFERFYRADKARSRSGGRYGLGLAICKGMVQADGGSIQVESEVGKGSVFRVRFPRLGG